MDKKDQGFQFKLITEVGDFGLLQPLARTRGRLVMATLVANVAFIGATWLVAHYINNASTSVGLNMLLITLTMLLMLAASYIDAMLLGDLMFPGNWRERVLLGQATRAGTDEAMSVDNHRNFNLHFLVALAFIIVGNYFAVGALSGDWLTQYHEMGFHLTRLRGDDNAEKIRALKELSKSIYAERNHERRVNNAILGELNNEDEEVRRWAMYAVRKAGLIDAYDALKGQLSAGQVQTRADAALTLGLLNDKRATPHLTQVLATATDSKPQLLGALRGLARLGDPEAGPAIIPLTDHADPEVRATAFWTLGKIKHVAAHDLALKRYETSEDAIDRCAALETLFRIPRPEQVQKFKDFFLLNREDPECQYIIWEEYNGDKEYIMYKETHRAKFLRYVANAVGGEERDWFTFVAADKERPYNLRFLAGQIIKEIDR